MTDETRTANFVAEINPHSSSSDVSDSAPEGRITVKGSLLERAKKNDTEALKTIFQQFLPQDEEIVFTEYYGYTGFAFVGSYSFACLTDKRVASLRVGPFKKVSYSDGFLENMTSGGVYQPSKFWLYILMFFGFFIGIGIIGYVIFNILWVVGDFLGLIYTPDIFSTFEEIESYSDPTNNLTIISGILALPLLPFFMNSIIIVPFYRFNPCGLACWVRERRPVIISVSREKMLKANKFYRIWSDKKDSRIRFIKNKMKIKAE